MNFIYVAPSDLASSGASLLICASLLGGGSLFGLAVFSRHFLDHGTVQHSNQSVTGFCIGHIGDLINCK